MEPAAKKKTIKIPGLGFRMAANPWRNEWPKALMLGM